MLSLWGILTDIWMQTPAIHLEEQQQSLNSGNWWIDISWRCSTWSQELSSRLLTEINLQRGWRLTEEAQFCSHAAFNRNHHLSSESIFHRRCIWRRDISSKTVQAFGCSRWRIDWVWKSLISLRFYRFIVSVSLWLSSLLNVVCDVYHLTFCIFR